MSVNSGLKLMAIGDVHLGTRPGSLPEALADLGVDPQTLTPAAALRTAVDYAIEKQVHAVVFAGDVVESTNARFEALVPLENAVKQLLEAGISVLGVVGNHDVEALPRLAKLVDGFKLLGEGGQWESHVVEVSGQPAVEIVGWSFPERQVTDSPVAQLLRSPLAPKYPGLPRIGVMHGDLDASGGPYAPMTTQELRDTGLSAWLLGHIHAPSLGASIASSDALPHGYLGSLVGLHPNETGAHGPWLIQLDGEGGVLPRQLVNAPLRWEHIDLRIEEAETVDDLGDRVLEEAERFARKLHDDGHVPTALGLRVRLRGRTQHYDALEKWIADGRWNEQRREVGGTAVFINKVVSDLELAVDLTEIAKGDDPPALLAQKLLTLRQDGDARTGLLDEARGALRMDAHDVKWSPLDDRRDAADPLSDDALQRALEQSGIAALNMLLSQSASVDDDRGGAQ